MMEDRGLRHHSTNGVHYQTFVILPILLRLEKLELENGKLELENGISFVLFILRMASYAFEEQFLSLFILLPLK